MALQSISSSLSICDNNQIPKSPLSHSHDDNIIPPPYLLSQSATLSSSSSSSSSSSHIITPLHLQKFHRAIKYRNRRFKQSLVDTSAEECLANEYPLSPCSVDAENPHGTIDGDLLIQAIAQLKNHMEMREYRYGQARADESRLGYTPMEDRQAYREKLARELKEWEASVLLDSGTDSDSDSDSDDRTVDRQIGVPSSIGSGDIPSPMCIDDESIPDIHTEPIKDPIGRNCRPIVETEASTVQHHTSNITSIYETSNSSEHRESDTTNETSKHNRKSKSLCNNKILVGRVTKHHELQKTFSRSAASMLSCKEVSPLSPRLSKSSQIKRGSFWTILTQDSFTSINVRRSHRHNIASSSQTINSGT